MGRRTRPAVKTWVMAAFALLCAACTEGSADCRDEVAAAFERLKTSGRPYRKEVTFVVSDQQTFRGTAEFRPPDQMREITNNGVAGYGTAETIQVGQRAWSSVGGWPWGWREWDPRFVQAISERGKDFSTLRDRPIPADAVFKCLGRVEFKGTAYLGYRARVDKTIVTVSPSSQEIITMVPSTEERGVTAGPSTEDRHATAAPLTARQQALVRRLQQMPQEWRTVFIDSQSMLPAYDLVAQENQLDDPRDKVQYTYPDKINIEPPLWCRLGLCRSALR